MSSNIPISWIIERLNSPLGKEQRVFKPARHVVRGPTFQWEAGWIVTVEAASRPANRNDRLVLEPRSLEAGILNRNAVVHRRGRRVEN